MKRVVLYLAIVAVALLSACSTSKKLNWQSQLALADQHYSAGHYSEALSAYQLVDSTKRNQQVYYKMAVSALKVGQLPMGTEFASRCGIVNDSLLVSEYRIVLDSLSSHADNAAFVDSKKSYFESVLGSEFVNNKLAPYYKSINSSKLSDVYPILTDANVRSECFPVYYSQVKSSKEESEMISICKSALKDNGDQLIALKYLGVMQYNKSEAEYKKAMDEYNKNKNQTAYAYLRRDLKVISKEYIKSRDYLDKVHKLDPSDQQTIKILININNRLDQPAKAKALQKELKQ